MDTRYDQGNAMLSRRILESATNVAKAADTALTDPVFARSPEGRRLRLALTELQGVFAERAGRGVEVRAA